MNVLGVGMSELFFIVVVALIILGPKDMQKAGRSIGGFLHKLVTSSEWRLVKDATRQIKMLPDQLMREANRELEELRDDVSGAVEIDQKVKRPKPLMPERTEVAESSQQATSGNDAKA